MKKPYQMDSFGESTVKGYRWINPGVTPWSVLVIAHGMAETIDRYDHFARWMATQGVVVYGHSHRGHGQTAGSPEALGDLGENGWIKTREDLRRALEMAAREEPECPLFLLGHSMGSFLSRDLLHDLMDRREGRSPRGLRLHGGKDPELAGVILSGTGWLSRIVLLLGKWAASVEMRMKGPLHPSRMMHQLSFGRYNQRIEKPLTFYDWLSCDAEQVKAYVQDPFCGQVHSSRFYREFFHHVFRIQYRCDSARAGSGYPKKGLKPPLLLIAGEQDPVGDYGRAMEQVASFYRQCGFDSTHRLYPEGRHEMLNEINREDVYQQIIRWMKRIAEQ